jgi:hypothetical protein
MLIPREADGGVSPANLELALQNASSSLSAAVKAQHWAKMTRRIAKRDAPPLIKEKWDLAGSRDAKQQIFGLYLACGGDVGKMEVVESICHRETHAASVSLGWFTRADLVARYHGAEDMADSLIDRVKNSAPNRIRDHPDFPGVAKMRQYKAFDDAKESHTVAQERVRSLHWTASISGALALELAENIKKMLSITAPDDVLAEVKPDGKNGRRRGGGADPAGVPPAPKPKPPKKASDPIKTYTSAMAAKSLEMSTIMMDLRARLSEHTWTSGLIGMLDKEINSAQSLHDSFIKSSPETLGRHVAEYRAMVGSATQVIKAGDSMIGAKKRKMPVEPTLPDGVVVPIAVVESPAAESPVAESPAAASVAASA